MTEVGIRDLRNNLSRFLERVRKGETIVVTERGRPIAKIVPEGVPEGLLRLAEQGKVTRPTRPPYVPKKRIPIRPGPPLSDYISEDRL